MKYTQPKKNPNNCAKSGMKSAYNQKLPQLGPLSVMGYTSPIFKCRGRESQPKSESPFQFI